MKKIVIIGGGAAGMTAAIAAARKDGKAEIHIYEHKDLAGKKLLSTGNGRCNFTNEKMSTDFYYSEDLEVVRQVLSRFGTEETLKFFRELGIFSKSKNGYYYPRSEQAAVVRELFALRLESLGIHVHAGVHVSSIKREGAGFRIGVLETGERKKTAQVKADKVILCAGGKASPVLGSDGSGYELAKGLGHTIVPVVPALVQLRVKDNPLKAAAGVRTDAVVSIYENRKLKGADTGELQITDYGISGIPVFQVSRYAAKSLYYKRPVRAEIDFLPELQKDVVTSMMYLGKKRHGQRQVSELLLGVFNKKLIPCLLKYAGIPMHLKLSELDPDAIHRLACACKNFSLNIEATNGFSNAQICAGGVRLKEIDPATMESLRCENLYLAGELLDADGICGGYNLQWAWATGYLAGLNAAADQVSRIN